MVEALQKTNDSYLGLLKSEFDQLYEIATVARSKGFDPALQPETLVTADLAERVEKSVGPGKIAERIRDLSKLMPREELAFKVAEEIVLRGATSNGRRIEEQAVRTSLAILDEGVTVAPIEGIYSVKTRKNHDGKIHLAIYFASPIRAAGGTDMGLTLVVADFIRRLMGLDKYTATEIEAKRVVEEARLYEREVARFQYHATDNELRDAIMHLPIEVNGVETNPVEVASFRNVPRVETNRVRGGALLVVNDGLIGRSHKIISIVDKMGLEGWSWLKELEPKTNDLEDSKDFRYMEDVLAGRPIFSFPNAPGGFRLRYGRARNTGLAAVGIHPATMAILRNFIATGTQLRIERPGKAGVAAPVQSIETPVVKLRDGSVIRVEDESTASRVAGSIESILFLGDILIAFGEFLENNRRLAPSGFVEEWWASLLAQRLRATPTPPQGISAERVEALARNPWIKPDPTEAVTLSKQLGVPLHPKYTYYWEGITVEEVKRLRDLLLQTNPRPDLINAGTPEVKAILERLWVPHQSDAGSITVKQEAIVLYACLALGDPSASVPLNAGKPREVIEAISGIKILEKAPTFIGARMGRPEKANRREMKPIVHCLFPVGLAGGPRRDVLEAAKTKAGVSVELITKRCPKCRQTIHLSRCSRCDELTAKAYTCPACGRMVEGPECPACKVSARAFDKRLLDVADEVQRAIRRLGLNRTPDSVKGVRGLTSASRTPEALEKGLLRAKHDLSMFKDGTIRFDATNAPLTHFKPLEIGTSIVKLMGLGYGHDCKGEELQQDGQLCALAVQDIIVPEKCADYFIQVAAFIDELLERLYDLPPYYRIKDKGDLVGHLVIGLSPHTSVGVLGRIIGFTKSNVCLAHPFWHAAKRRDCDGDEDSITLALDILLNFSRSFLPERIGGLMDAPLLLTLYINPKEVPRQAFNAETVDHLPVEFFEETRRGADPKRVAEIVPTVAHALGKGETPINFGFTHQVDNINAGNHESSYKKLGSMLEKMKEQLDLAEKTRAVKAAEVAKKVLSTHLMRDVTGNLKAFSSQRFRCAKCNAKMRRMPLTGACPRCGGKVALTVYRGTIEKYLEAATGLVKRYDLGIYSEQRLQLLKEEIDSLFHKGESRQQKGLADYL